MKYELKFTLSKIDLYNSSINFIKRSKTYIFDVFFTLVALAALIFTIIKGDFLNMPLFNRVLLIIACLIFPVLEPLIVYFKSTKASKLYENKLITIACDDKKLYVSMENENIDISYENVYDFIKFRNMCVIMYDNIRGQIIPKRAFINNVNMTEFYDYVATKIKVARKKAKIEKEINEELNSGKDN